jgi:outer membrane protein OmpA-like peptidoglycan-associated protein
LGAIIGKHAGKNDNSGIGAVIGTVVGGTAGVIIGHKMDKQAHKIEEEVPGAQVERVENGIVVTFDDESGVHFATNKYNLNNDAQIILNKLAAIFTEYPDTRILIVGHTDNVGSESYNMKLSKKRAKSVTNYFVKYKNMSSSRFVTKWFGETKPVYDNNIPEGRAKNRRVNIVILPNEEMIKKAEEEANN